MTKTSPFEFVKQILQGKKQLIVDDITEKEYKPFFNVGGELVCYDCVEASKTISYNVKDNFPNLEPNKWAMKDSVQYYE